MNEPKDKYEQHQKTTRRGLRKPKQEPLTYRCPGCDTLYVMMVGETKDMKAMCSICRTTFIIGEHLEG